MHFRLGLLSTCLSLTIAGLVIAHWSHQSVNQAEAVTPRSSEKTVPSSDAVTQKVVNLDHCLARLREWSDEIATAPEVNAVDSPLVGFARGSSGVQSASRIRRDRPGTLFDLEVAPIQLVTYTTDDLPAIVTPDQIKKDREKVYWPKPKHLIKQLETLQQIEQSEPWATEVLDLLDQATQSAVDSSEIGEIFQQLESRVLQVQQISTAIWNSNSPNALAQSSEVARFGYRLSRRLAVWKSVYDISTNSFKLGDGKKSQEFVSYRRIDFTNLDPRWADYLQMEEFGSAFASLNPNRGEQKKSARQVLARAYSPVLKPEQLASIQEMIDPSVLEYIKEQATDPVDIQNLLTRVDQYESLPSSFTGHYLNDQYQNLLWSGDPADRAVAAELNAHYRNANFRLAVSDRLLNRMIPRLPSIAMPVSENVQGARVSGQSHVTNEIRVSLVPDPNRLMLSLETAGHVQSDTVARTKTFRILNQGEARFQAFKRLAIGRDGIDSSQRPVLSSSANQYVVGVESDLDNLPILGWVARKLAVKKLREKAPETDRLFREKVETSAESQIQKELETQLVKLRQYAYKNLMQPLLAMELEPEPLQMATTKNQIVMRYRLAGRDQMAANTARPRDSGASLLSFQLHQSSINNAIARIGLNGKSFTVQELTEHLEDVFGQPIGSADAEETQRQAEFGFAPFDPIRIDFKEDRINITLNLRTLKIEEKGKTWKNVSLTVAYQLVTDGMQISMVQDDLGTRIKGKRLRVSDKAALSTVMKVVFKKQYAINALPKGIKEKIGGPPLEVSQLVISNGWIGVSIDDGLPPIQQAESSSGQRPGTIRRLLPRR